MRFADIQISQSPGFKDISTSYLDVYTQGLGRDSNVIIVQWIEATDHYFSPLTRETIGQKFRALVAAWRSETAHLSSITHMAMHPAYQEIIGMGPPVVPLLLRELGNMPDHWFWALKAITGVDPVLPSERGRVKKMAEAWLRWGKEEGYTG